MQRASEGGCRTKDGKLRALVQTITIDVGRDAEEENGAQTGGNVVEGEVCLLRQMRLSFHAVSKAGHRTQTGGTTTD